MNTLNNKIIEIKRLLQGPWYARRTGMRKLYQMLNDGMINRSELRTILS